MANLLVWVTAVGLTGPDEVELAGMCWVADAVAGTSGTAGWTLFTTFEASAAEINRQCIDKAIEAVAAMGHVVGPNDVRRLISGAVPNIS